MPLPPEPTCAHLCVLPVVTVGCVFSHPKVVTSCLEHCSEYLIVQLACNMAGAACFPLETHFGPQMLQAHLDSHDAGLTLTLSLTLTVETYR